MPAPYSSLGSKNDRAVVAYLIAYALANNLTGIINANTVFPVNYANANKYPNVTVQSLRGKPLIPFTGDLIVETRIVIKYSAVQGVKPANPGAARLAGDTLTENIVDALSLSNNGSDTAYTAAQITIAARALVGAGDANAVLNNADMGDYTCLFWIPDGFERGQPDEEGTAWAERAVFQSHCCPSAVN